MSWQDEIREDARDFGLEVSSGYRSPGHNAAIGGAPGSRHTLGTPTQPGAMDLSGPANVLRNLFEEIKQSFKGRIAELYLNIPGSGWAALKDGLPLRHNPEAGRGQQLHVSLRDSEPTDRKVAMRLGTDVANAGGQLGAKGEAALRRAGIAPEGVGLDQERCSARVCLPTVPHLLDPPPCVCWSDLWAYGGGAVAVCLGLWMLLGNRES